LPTFVARIHRARCAPIAAPVIFSDAPLA
jgi:hypothetical protein